MRDHVSGEASKDPRVKALVDRCGRRITRLRIAVSDRCNFRCFYCRPSGNDVAPRCRLLSADEILAVAEAGVACGIASIRLTGGEPLLREDLLQIVSRICRLSPGLDVSLTTNGYGLAELADRLATAGLKRVNVSLDSLRRDRFGAITRQRAGSDSLHAVLAGLEAARRAGLRPIKVNMVVVRGVNDDEICEMARFGEEHGYQIRFIEFMPLDGNREWRPEALVPVDEIRARLEGSFGLTPLPDGGSPGDEFLLGAGPTRVSLIGTISQPFCDRCNRMRVTADGFLRACLFSSVEHDLRPALAAADREKAIAAAFAAAVAHKPAGHRIGQTGFVPPPRAMFSIGG
jgi:cyclic pyranopterin phosphate synthase